MFGCGGVPCIKERCALFYVFLRAFCAHGEQNVCIFTWYPHNWGALCMHFYVVSAYLGGTLYAFLRGIRIPGGHFV